MTEAGSAIDAGPITADETLAPNIGRIMTEILAPLDKITEIVRRALIGTQAVSALPPFAAVPPTTDARLAAFCRAQEEWRSICLRRKMLDDSAFGDSCWSILIDLYVRHRQGLRTSVSSSCIASGIPPTTALRHLKLLTDRGWITKVRDPHDARRFFVEITPWGVDRMTNLLAADARQAPTHAVSTVR